MKQKNILNYIGNTPLVKLNKIVENKDVEIWLKLEGYNPSGSIKDRVALSMIRSAEKSGELTKDIEILEATSGNMGISLSFVGTVLGYKVTIVMSSDASEERKKLIKMLGARLILTSASEGEMGAREKADKIWKKNKEKYWFADQFSNKDNPDIHMTQTAQEILDDMPDVTHIFAAMGTGGTLLGLSNALKKYSVNIIGIQPHKESYIDGLVNFEEEQISPIWKDKSLNNLIYVKRSNALKTTKHLVRKEGILAGISTGAAVYEALRIAKSLSKGKFIVISADRVEKYFSTELFLD